MKKLVIAGASVALAAMPVLGAFAATSVTTQDTISVTVPHGCTVNDTERTTKTAAFGEVAPGADGTAQSTSAMVINCNKAWTVTPSTEGLTSASGTTILSAAANAKGSQFKVALATSSTDGITNAFPSATGIDGSKNVAGSAAASDLSITPTYSIHIGNQQEQGTYSGTVTYTIALGA